MGVGFSCVVCIWFEEADQSSCQSSGRGLCGELLKTLLQNPQALAQYVRRVEGKGGISFKKCLKLPCVPREHTARFECLGGSRVSSTGCYPQFAYDVSRFLYAYDHRGTVATCVGNLHTPSTRRKINFTGSAWR